MSRERGQGWGVASFGGWVTPLRVRLPRDRFEVCQPRRHRGRAALVGEDLLPGGVDAELEGDLELHAVELEPGAVLDGARHKEMPHRLDADEPRDQSMVQQESGELLEADGVVGLFQLVEGARPAGGAWVGHPGRIRRTRCIVRFRGQGESSGGE